ncbi:hypothetical protein WSM22_03610 [Cytophagales bacterium WSM2-2]|nr:hypothetical protein WSM22_03610 [Cytophagales bacterium WSM2-2]
MTEDKKREQIIQSIIPKTKAPQELYSQSYRGSMNDYANSIKPTIADPNSILKNFRALSPSAEEQRQMADADIAAYEAQKQQRQRLLNEASKELETPTIRYNLGIHNSDAAEIYANAYTQLNAMLTGSQQIDFLKATWLVESSLDRSLSWEEFNKMFQDDVQIIAALMQKDKLSPNDNLAKLMAIYKFMADTTTVFVKSKEKNVTTHPMFYDYDDYEGKKDITKVFVSKLLRTGTGQCMSLPMLYFLYAKALGADAHLAFAPQHTYITFKDHLGDWQNIELTGKMFTTNDFYWQSGFIKTEQRKSGIYLTPISDKETISYLLTTLTLTYIKKFGTDDRALEMALTARENFPKSLTANMIVAGYTQELWKDILRQYDVFSLNETQLANDQKAQSIKKAKEAAKNHLLKDLGYAEMPQWAYKQWLDGVNKLANKKQHVVKRRQLEHQLNR